MRQKARDDRAERPKAEDNNNFARGQMVNKAEERKDEPMRRMRND